MLGWSSCPFPGQAHTAVQRGCWRLASATEADREHRDRLSRPVTDSQAQGERDRMPVPAAKEGSDVCEDKVTESNRET